MTQMDSRAYLFVGFSLLGVYFLAQVVIDMPSLFAALAESMNMPSRGGREKVQVLILARTFFEALAGFFLIIKGPSLARYLADRNERIADRSSSTAMPPNLPQN